MDSTQSVQAQTLATHEKARLLGLNIIPVVTKIDLPNAQPEDTALSMGTTFNLDPCDVIMTSAKKGVGILELIEAVVDRLPSPEAKSGLLSDSFMGRIVDSWYDEHRGVVCLVQVVSGQVREGQRIAPYASMRDSKDGDSKSDFSVQEVGLLTPGPLRTKVLIAGQVGYVIAGLRSTRQARIGDTIYMPAEWVMKGAENALVPLSGYEDPKPMLYASVFPVDNLQLEEMMAAVNRLLLNDSSVSVCRDQSASLGSGLRCGFLGFLHMEVFNQRLQDEFNMGVVMTTPSVPYILRQEDGSETRISCVSEWPDAEKNKSFQILEPIVKVKQVNAM